MVNIKKKGILSYAVKKEKKINCPKCSTLLRKEVMSKLKHPSGALLDVCNNCGGMWVDKEEIKMLYDYSIKYSMRRVKK